MSHGSLRDRASGWLSPGTADSTLAHAGGRHTGSGTVSGLDSDARDPAVAVAREELESLSSGGAAGSSQYGVHEQGRIGSGRASGASAGTGWAHQGASVSTDRSSETYGRPMLPPRPKRAVDGNSSDTSVYDRQLEAARGRRERPGGLGVDERLPFSRGRSTSGGAHVWSGLTSGSATSSRGSGSLHAGGSASGVQAPVASEPSGSLKRVTSVRSVAKSAGRTASKLSEVREQRGARVRNRWNAVRSSVTARVGRNYSAVSKDFRYTPPGGRDGETLRGSVAGGWRGCCLAPFRSNLPAPSVHAVMHVNFLPLDPESLAVRVWQMVLLVSIVSQLVLVPVRSALDPAVLRNQWHVNGDWGASGWDALGWIYDVVFCLDVLLSFNLGVIRGGVKVMDSQQIRSSYMASVWIWLDVASSFPADFVLGLAGISAYDFRWLRLLRVAHVPRLWSSVDEALSIRVRNALLSAKMVATAGFLSHLTGCLWLKVSSRDGWNTDGSRPFLAPAALSRAPSSVQWLQAIYWSFGAMTGSATTGQPTSMRQHLLSVCVMLTGVLLVAWVIGAVSRLVRQMDVSHSTHRSRMLRINQFFKHHPVPRDVHLSVLHFFEFMYEESGGRDLSQVLEGLPACLRIEVALSLTKETVSKVPIFAKSEDEFVVSLVKTLRPMTVERDDFVITEGQVLSSLYLVSWGQIDLEVGGPGSRPAVDARVLRARDAVELSPWRSAQLAASLRAKTHSPINLNGGQEEPAAIVVQHLNAGSYFGDYALIDPTHRSSASARAVTFAHVYELRHADYDRTLARYAFSKTVIEGNIRKLRRTSIAHERRTKTAALARAARGLVANLRFEDHLQSQRVAEELTRSASLPDVAAGVVRTAVDVWRTKVLRRRKPPRSSVGVELGDLGSPTQREPRPTVDQPVVCSPHSSSQLLTRMIQERAAKEEAAARDSAAQQRSPHGMALHGRVEGTDATTPSGLAKQIAAAAQQRRAAARRLGVLHPYSRTRWFWITAMQIVVVYNLITIPLRSTFDIERTSAINVALDIVADIAYAVDIVIVFHTGFYCRGMLVTDKREIAKAYYRSYFWLDVVSTLPVDWVALPWVHDSGATLIRLNRLLRIIRLERWFDLWSLEMRNERAASSLAFSGARLAKLVFLLLTSFHLVACAFYSWVWAEGWGNTADAERSLPLWAAADRADPIHGASFLAPHDLRNSTIGMQYMYSLWAVIKPRGILRDLRPVRIGPALFALFVQTFGFFFYAYVIGAMGALVANMDESAAMHRARRTQAEQFLVQRQLPGDLVKRVARFFASSWELTHGTSAHNVCSELPRMLRKRLKVCLYAVHVRAAAMFSDLPADVVVAICDSLIPEVLPQGQVVFTYNETGHEMYIVEQGLVDVFCLDVNTNEDGVPYKTLGNGALVGEVAFFEGVRASTVRTRTVVELLALPYDDFERVLKLYIGLEARLRIAAKRRLRRLMRHRSRLLQSLSLDEQDTIKSQHPTWVPGGVRKDRPLSIVEENTEAVSRAAPRVAPLTFAELAESSDSEDIEMQESKDASSDNSGISSNEVSRGISHVVTGRDSGNAAVPRLGSSVSPAADGVEKPKHTDQRWKPTASYSVSIDEEVFSGGEVDGSDSAGDLGVPRRGAAVQPMDATAAISASAAGALGEVGLQQLQSLSADEEEAGPHLRPSLSRRRVWQPRGQLSTSFGED